MAATASSRPLRSWIPWAAVLFLFFGSTIYVCLIPVRPCHACLIREAYEEQLAREGTYEFVEGKFIVKDTPPRPPTPLPFCENCKGRKKMTLLIYWLRRWR